jgi:hypothetical protein
VPYWEWDALGSSEAAKQEYLRAALQGEGALPFPMREARSER